MKSNLLDLPDWDAQVLNHLQLKPKGVAADSREVKPGDLFLACRGEYIDGRDYIAAAIKKGAAAVLWDDADGFRWNPNWQAANHAVSHLREQAGIIAAHILGDPSHKMSVIGVTGTNGKTSITSWLTQCFSLLQRKSAMIGTIGNGFYGEQKPSSHTTPAPVKVQQLLAEFQKNGAEIVAMEVSSHGLHQARVNGVHFYSAIFTNLTRDHFDYHHDLITYGEVKRLLFHWQGLHNAIINVDDAFGRDIAEKVRAEGVTEVITYGIEQGDVRASNIKMSLAGLELDVATPWGETHLSCQLLGLFNVYNLLACLAALCVDGVTLIDAVRVLSQVTPALGRMQRLGGAANQPLVVIDYAHTPDALEKALLTLRQIKAKENSIYCVFGCGGNRDQGKRTLMGKIAQNFADKVVITSDNPRNEEPQAILQDILLGAPNPALLEVDRARAIDWAINQAQAGDIVLIAGKGHEEYQEIKQVRHAFSDAKVAAAALSHLSHGKEAFGENQLSLSLVAQLSAGEFSGRDAFLSRINHDSRQVRAGDLYIALKGLRFDGHDFVSAALNTGALGALVNQDFISDDPRLIRVDDTQLALGRLAAEWRKRFQIKVIGITGSNGKTTVKEMLSTILRTNSSPDEVLATAGNFNNDIGMPLTLLRLNDKHRYAVIEMGMNHAGEIAYLSNIAKPDIAILNNVSLAHFGGGFSCAEDIAHAKAEIFTGLSKNGIALINADDAYAKLFREQAVPHRIYQFALANGDVYAEDIELTTNGSSFILHTPLGATDIKLATPGEHNIKNALAAAAAALLLNVPLSAIKTGLSTFGGVIGRLQYRTASCGAQIIDDTYNANPESMKAALDVLAQFPEPRIFIMGDIGELGSRSLELHAEIGAYAAKLGIKNMLTLGLLSKTAAETYVAASKKYRPAAKSFYELEPLLAFLKHMLNHETTILIKGSRFMHMEQVVDYLVTDKPTS